EVVQVDDKWQNGPARAGPCADYSTHRPDGPYPSGMQATAKKIAAAGLTPGLWFLPFASDPRLPAFKDHRDWFVHRKSGRLHKVRWAGTCLDMTHPGAREYLRGIVSRITREWGFKYIKIDGLWSGMAAKLTYPEPKCREDKLSDAVFHDPAKTNVEAYRDGLALVRDAAGEDVFILGCCAAQNMRTLGASMGRVDAMRIGRDIGASWEAILPCATIGAHLYFLQGRVWHNDPDCLMLREPLTLEQARAWGSWIALSGQLNIVSEWLPGLPPERLEIVKRSMPNHGLCARPLDLFENPLPGIWHLAAGQGENRRHVVGFFNWLPENETSYHLPLTRLEPDGGLSPRREPDQEPSYVGFDFWSNEFLPPIRGALSATVEPGSCRVLALRRERGHPQVVSTSRHVAQGIGDVIREEWKPRSKTLQGSSLVVPGDPYELRIAVPSAEWRLKRAGVSARNANSGVTVAWEQSGTGIRVVLDAPDRPSARGPQRVAWEVGFAAPALGR
ncbi:MAG TPA: glycoside hydrolase family 36 protein, partial [Sumerlaeia bacterium]|nr:glycoside hydrolase family 36 protein [Sumerlaeia bacterium]